ncbi:PAS domain-containing hybrid sensor histidine kinase/response regulator [Geothrix terrae]|uniref:PAS domain-containing hybrid sensor histidine kinase/response regulator n=1 Tax=Geothrix terrae TaxID=2922720 RepID=UPI001FAB3960
MSLREAQGPGDDPPDDARSEERRGRRFEDAITSFLPRIGRMAKVGGWSFDVDSGEGWWTEEVARIHDLDPSTPASSELGLSFYTAESRPLIERAIQEAIEKGRPYDLELELVSAKGVRKWVWTQGQPVVVGGRVVRVQGTFQDITDRKRTELALRESQGRLQMLIDHAPAALAMFDREMRYLAVSRRWLSDFHLGDQAILGRSHYDIFPEIPEAWREAHRRGLAGEVMQSEEDRFVRQDGTVYWRRWELRPWHAGDGTVGGIVIFSEDITGRVEAIQALRESEQRFRLALRNAPVSVAVQDRDLRYVWAYNHRTARPEDVVGRRDADLFSPDQAARLDELKRKVLEEGAEIHQQMWLDRPGRRLFLDFYCEPMRDAEGRITGVGTATVDLTPVREAEEERRRLEAEVAHGQKLESLGALAGGVSHDMNNVLAAIMAVASMLKEKRQDDADLVKSMDTLLHAAGRGRDLVKGLTDFARKDLPEPQPLELNELVRKEAALLQRTTLQKVEVELALAEGLPLVMGDPSAISNALMNLCVNALDAMPEGGRLRLATRSGAAGMVELAVEDSGHGMPPEVLGRALEPFFTTKPAGKGTGLGLALVYGVMKAHGGRVDLRSAPGQGTEITLSFPAYRADLPFDAGIALAEEAGVRRLRILLVDDDELVRGTVPVMLEALGHEVLAAAGGPQALERLEAGYTPDLVILDLSMPGMDGEETLRRLRLLRPDLPVLLATGYRDERGDRILEQGAHVGLILKPFTLMDLKLKLGQMG